MPGERVVYGIGDSLIGCEVRIGQPLYHLREMLDRRIRVEARGVGGETSTQVIARLRRDVVDQVPAPDACIVLAGINDIQIRSPAVAIIANLETIYRTLLDAGIHPIALTIYPFGNHKAWTPTGEAARREVRAWMRETLPVTLPAVEVVDVEDVLADYSDRDRPVIRAEYDDGTALHLNYLGAAAVARVLVEQSRMLSPNRG